MAKKKSAFFLGVWEQNTRENELITVDRVLFAACKFRDLVFRRNFARVNFAFPRGSASAFSGNARANSADSVGFDTDHRHDRYDHTYGDLR